MRCPFLKEAQVKYCRASAFRTMIVRVPGQPDADLCTSSAYETCPAYRQHHAHDPGKSRCPYLQEALMQYCGAASMTKYIPYSEALLSHCGTESYKYCELFLTMAHPERVRLHTPVDFQGCVDDGCMEEYMVESVAVPGWLHYSANHMWADRGPDGCVHIGIDAFLAGMLGSIDRIAFVTTEGVHRPTVVFTANNTDLSLVFPGKVAIAAVNSYLRSQPSVILTDPYTRGWLFEGAFACEENGPGGQDNPPELLTGRKALSWMHDEIQRATRVAHELSHTCDEQGIVTMADGGALAPGLFQRLSRQEILQIFNEFFSPFAGGR